KSLVFGKRGIIFLQDNVRLFVAITIQRKLRELIWKVLYHAPYSLDLPLTDYHLFRPL
ncbi:hypothetical protein WH47_10198, partial [Habropoda laboriosa]